MFMSSAAGGDTLTIICCHDSSTQRIAGCVLPSKEVHPYTVAWMEHQVHITGHRRVLLKSDQEHSITALKKALCRELDRSIEIIHEESAVKDSDGNGA
eukprot:927510-Amphidinium_carterae.1